VAHVKKRPIFSVSYLIFKFRAFMKPSSQRKPTVVCLRVAGGAAHPRGVVIDGEQFTADHPPLAVLPLSEQQQQRRPRRLR
jgi:hypothetical protein